MRLADGKPSFSPSDVTSYLACEHLTQLERQVALGRLVKPERDDPEGELVKRKGLEHERAYLDSLRVAGRTVAEIELEPDLDFERAARETEEALRAGVDVVFQGVFVDGDWRGVADFLERQADGSYEAVDTKLARNAKPAHVLQLCFYTEQLARLQGRDPARMHVQLGSGERASFRPEEFGAYYRRVRARFLDFVSFDRETEPYPVAFCDWCDFRPLCDEWWERADHLSRAARLTRRHFRLLRDAGITTLAGLARSEGPVDGIDPAILHRLREQAALQLAARETGRQDYRLVEPTPGTGLALLPPPSRGDLFFDLEGNPFWDATGSLEYLWGWTDADGRFGALWARDRDEERRAFERFVDLVHARLAGDPALHVYHYASYETTVLRRLMGRYGTREREVDDLLRRGVFVDLYAVVRNGVRVSQPRYGLKNMEAFLELRRQAKVKEGGASIVMFEEWMRTGDDAILGQIAAYNEEDCRATHLLRDWLLERQREALARFGSFPVPEPEQPSEERPEHAERAALRENLLAAGETLAAELLAYHRREEKPVWWAFFDRIEKTPSELVEDADSIGCLELAGGPEPVKKSLAWTLTYPPQEHKIGAGQEVIDPATGGGAGDVLSVDREERRLLLKRGPKFEDVPLPEALIPGGPFRTPLQKDALARLGRSLLAGDRRYPALESILRREPFPAPVQTTDLEQMKALVLGLDGRHLFVQGPPGSGKTWTGGRLISHLLAEGKTVGVASMSHKAIHKLLEAVEEAGLSVPARKKASAGNPESFYPGEAIENVTDGEAAHGVPLVAGTAWLLCHQSFDGVLDYLFLDEGGQVSLADALAMGTCARNVVLLGDPNQLGQVLQGAHPGGTAVSVLEHLLGDETTIPENRGLFLERTYRLHPDVCAYVSEAFYGGRLESDERTAARTTPFGTGLRYLAVEHEGRRQESPEEAGRVAEEVERLLGAGMRPEQLIVVAPYNAHVNLLRQVVRRDVPVGTVDKFQGQEADVVLYSMASSSGEDIPRSLEFLFSRNRLNVAISRARCLAYLVASPRLLEVDAKTIGHMRLANALCRFVELAESS
jgi:predicted RecB family nuclease